LRLEIALATPLVATPATRASNEKRERQEKAVAAIEGDPFVRDVMDIFDANIDESTIKPV
jgi:DNA polymerase-3 subunit gamma/tau